MRGNFVIRALKDDKGYFTAGKIYRFERGKTIWDDKSVSCSYEDFRDLIGGNPDWAEMIEEIKSPVFENLLDFVSQLPNDEIVSATIETPDYRIEITRKKEVSDHEQ